jgi:predicted alpha/beta superfamily hydrolase
MKSNKLLLLLVIFCNSLVFHLAAQSHYSGAKLELKEHKISSRVLNEERVITIYKPPVHPEYANVVSPVIYVLDGEFYIDYVSSMISLVCERFVTMPPITVVSIHNTPIVTWAATGTCCQ